MLDLDLQPIRRTSSTGNSNPFDEGGKLLSTENVSVGAVKSNRRMFLFELMLGTDDSLKPRTISDKNLASWYTSYQG